MGGYLLAKKDFPTWDEFYAETDVEQMPWFEKNLDEDVKRAIESMKISSGRFLDLGTGPGTQAMQLTKLGFDAVGSDLSQNAINRAQKLYPETSYVVDDILNSKLHNDEFDFILDRGVFHVFDQDKHTTYLNQITRILKKDGTLFLKCMSAEEKSMKDGKGPYLYSKEQVREIFENYFQIHSIIDSVYYGTLKPLPKSLFAVMTNKK